MSHAGVGKEMKIRDASPGMAVSLSNLAIRAKASWGYESSLLNLWKEDLEIEPDYIERNVVKVAEEDGDLIGVAALNLQDKEIDHFWVEPGCMARGVGKALFEAIKVAMKENGISRIQIVSDPHAESFYLHMGAKRMGEVESVPPGRRLPKLSFEFTQRAEQSSGGNH